MIPSNLFFPHSNGRCLSSLNVGVFKILILMVIVANVANSLVIPVEAATHNPAASILRYSVSRTGEAPFELNPPLALAWKTELGGPHVFGYFTSSPVAMNGIVYLGGGDGVYALDVLTGKIVWFYKTGGIVRSSPSIFEGILYVGSDEGTLHAIDARSGAKLWAFRTGGPVLSSPLVVEETVYVGSEDGALYALDSKSGALKWKFQTALRIVTSPAYAYNTVYFGSWDGYVYALDPVSGKVRWKYYTGSGIESSPAIADGVLYIAASYAHRAIALDAYNGKELWQYETGYKIISSPAVSGSLVFFGSSDAHVYAFDTRTGELRWKYNVNGGIAGSSPTISGEIVYIGAEDETLYAFEKNSGKLVWSFKVNATINSTPLVYGELLIFVSSDNIVYALTNQKVSPTAETRQSLGAKEEPAPPLVESRGTQSSKLAEVQDAENAVTTPWTRTNSLLGVFGVLASGLAAFLLIKRRSDRAMDLLRFLLRSPQTHLLRAKRTTKKIFRRGMR